MGSYRKAGVQLHGKTHVVGSPLLAARDPGVTAGEMSFAHTHGQRLQTAGGANKGFYTTATEKPANPYIPPNQKPGSKSEPFCAYLTHARTDISIGRCRQLEHVDHVPSPNRKRRFEVTLRFRVTFKRGKTSFRFHPTFRRGGASRGRGYATPGSDSPGKNPRLGSEKSGAEKQEYFQFPISKGSQFPKG